MNGLGRACAVSVQYRRFARNGLFKKPLRIRSCARECLHSTSVQDKVGAIFDKPTETFDVDLRTNDLGWVSGDDAAWRYVSRNDASGCDDAAVADADAGEDQ